METAQAGPLADATVGWNVVLGDTEVAQLNEDGIPARAEALGTNQDALISEQLVETMPSWLRLPSPFACGGQ